MLIANIPDFQRQIYSWKLNLKNNELDFQINCKYIYNSFIFYANMYAKYDCQ